MTCPELSITTTTALSTFCTSPKSTSPPRRPTRSSSKLSARVSILGEVPVREGLAHGIWPAAFPSGQGSDFAGRVIAVGAAVSGPEVGAEVLGFTNNRAAQADYVVVPATQVTPKPANVGWDEAGSLFVAGSTAYAAVRAVEAKPGGRHPR
ncbi:alcohol dehydrogenase catalytic domain-containing protein [Streptomyces sp. NPDC005808]|uniref:alcohol dehydrogenase catalytic domain-containing protein n=1 Tax=Streptomyces sp. NPDC005808 TaxID=3364734 RepID=UPI0036A93E34